jgi:hypothetical protein
MLRRSFCLGWRYRAGRGRQRPGLPALAGDYADLHYVGRDEGHFLRDRTLPPPSQVIHTDIAILGSGVPASPPHGS